MHNLKLDSVYGVAKSYGLKSLLFPYSFIQELADSKDVEDLVDRLRASPYGAHLAQLTRPYTPVKVERALWHSLLDVHFRLVNVSAQPRILHAYFLRYVHSNLKAVLRGKALGKGYDEIMEYVDLYPESLLGVRDEVLRAVGARDLQAAVAEIAKTDLAEAGRIAMEVWSTKKELVAFDMVVDKMFLQKLLEAFRGLPRGERRDFKPLISLELDTGIAASILRLKSWNLPPAEIKEFIPERGVEMDGAGIDLLISAREVGEAVSALQLFPWHKMGDVRDIQSLIRHLEKTASEYKISLASKYYYQKPMRNVLTLAIILLKEAEVRNIATIATGLYEGQPAARILERLVKTI
ncbi:V-type ATP synthase subunit C [archaeon HR01]|nr:V-type ATP synthase subunit C [archaeon HR01]